MVQRSTAQQAAFQALNDGHALWDVSTYRDVLTAPESGLRQAYDAGIPLVNVHILRDENGDTLPPNADIEDILDARELMHPDLTAPLAAHDRSSVMGGGSPFAEQLRRADPALPAPSSDDGSGPGAGAIRSASGGRVLRGSRRRVAGSAAGSGPRPRGERGSRSVRRAGRVAPEGSSRAHGSRGAPAPAGFG
jgi:hypothetical protein